MSSNSYRLKRSSLLPSEYDEESTDQSTEGQSGDIYVGETKNGQKNGNGTIKYSDGSQYSGNWEFNEKSGQGKCFFKIRQNGLCQRRSL